MPQLICPYCLKPLEPTALNHCGRSFLVEAGIVRLQTTAPTAGFAAEFFALLQETETKHFWFQSRNTLIEEVLFRQVPKARQKRILELGCGNGLVLAHLWHLGYDISGADGFLEGLREARLRCDAPLFQLDLSELDFPPHFDVIGLFDVLEHLVDEENLLQRIHHALSPQGVLLLTVPASPRLWSSYDAAVHHQRRYRRKDLCKRLNKHGYTIQFASHFVFLLYPLLLLQRLLLALFPAPDQCAMIQRAFQVPLGNRFWGSLMALERSLMRYFALPWGSSLIVVAQKEEK